MKEEERSRFDIVVAAWKRLDEIDRLETIELEERRMELKKTLDLLLQGLYVGKYDDMAIAVYNEAIGTLVEDNVKAITRRLEPSKIFRPNVAGGVVTREIQQKRDVPLLRVHNTLVHEGRIDRPVITYYRANGAMGRMEEAFKISGNKRSFLGAGSYYET